MDLMAKCLHLIVVDYVEEIRVMIYALVSG